MDAVLPGQANVMHIQSSAMVTFLLQATAGVRHPSAGKEPVI